MTARIAILLVVVLGFATTRSLQPIGAYQRDVRHDTGPTMTPELDNESVQVLRIRLEPHEKTPMHDITPRVVVWLTDARIRHTLADGSSREDRFKAGQVTWVAAQRHAGENMSAAPVEFHRGGAESRRSATQVA